MTLIGILIALGLERLLGQLPGWGRPVLFVAAMQGLRKVVPAAVWQSPVLPLLVVAIPAATVGWGLDQVESPIGALALSAAVLLLCLGPRDLAEEIHDLLRARSDGDVARTAQLERALQRGPNPGSSHRSLAGALFIQSHEKLFGTLLWFFAAGPAGAVAYRLASRLPRYLAETVPDTAALRAADTLHGLLAFLPARATALVYGLAGSLDDALQAWRHLRHEAELDWRMETWAVLAEVPTASLGTEEPDGSPVVPASLEAMLTEVLNMQWRALLIMLAGFALFATGTLL